MLVFGTRPEAIKMAPLYHQLKLNSKFETLVCITAQHREMLDQVLSLFKIEADIDLNLMKSGQDLFDISSSVMMAMRDVLIEHRPDMLLVHGDTTTAYAAAVAGFYTQTQVGHVEAGLRTYNMQSPFPEEFNRQVVSKVADLHFAPTVLSQKNLIAEGVDSHTIEVTGNTVIDALEWTLNEIQTNAHLQHSVTERLNSLINFEWMTTPFVLITGHRRENFGDGFDNICQAISQLATRYSDIQFVYPVHLNPKVQKPVYELLSQGSNIHLIDPLEYEPFVYLMQHCYLVLTDSGGIQEEAPSLGKPVLVMRDTTERPEAVSEGTVKLVGAKANTITEGVSELLSNDVFYQSMAKAHNPYGDGKASQRIVSRLSTDMK